MSLTREIEWFDLHRAELFEKHPGKWVVVFQDQLIGVYDSFEVAYADGVHKTNSETILVKLVTDEDEPFIAPALTLGLIDAPVYK